MSDDKIVTKKKFGFSIKITLRGIICIANIVEQNLTMMVFALSAALFLKHSHAQSTKIHKPHMLRNLKRHPERAEWQLLDLYWQ